MLWDDPKQILISMSPWNNGREQTVRLAKLNIYDGRVQELSRAPALNAELYADADGVVRFSSSTDDANNTVLHRFNPKTREWSVYQKAAFGEEFASPVALPSGGDSVFIQRAPDDGPLGIYEITVATGEQNLVFRHDTADARPLLDWQQSPWGAELEYGKHEFVPLDPEHPYTALVFGLEQAFPADRIRVLGGTHDFRLTIVEVSGGHLPEQYYLYDASVGALSKLFDSDPVLSGQDLAEVTPIELRARDGLELHGYLTLPPRSAGQNLPLVVMPHGGPFGVNDSWQFNRENQLLASRGYAVLQVNFRGSGGFGPGFQAAGIGERGDAMQDDVTDATRWAISEGYADPARICLYGWSHGGYAALRGVSREPALYQCAVGAAGVYDFDIQYRKADYTRYRYGRAYMRQSLGTDPAKLRAISPVHSAERIEAAVFLVHGEQDERVPVEHARAMRRALNAAGKPPRYLERRGEGHGFFKEENRAHFYAELLEFLDLHIGIGRKSQ